MLPFYAGDIIWSQRQRQQIHWTGLPPTHLRPGILRALFPVCGECGEAQRLTVGIQQSGDPQLSLCDAEGLLQVLLVASSSGFGQIHHVWPQRIQDRQENHAGPPASFEVFHI